MQTLKTESCTFHFDGDPLIHADVEIVVKDARVGGFPSHTIITVAGTDLVLFVAELIRRKRIAALNNTTDKEILGL